MKSSSVVDLFCGIGGLTHGFVQEDFKVIAGIDADSSCRYAYEKNNKARFIHRGIEEVTSEEISDLYPRNDIRILVGCAPCQPFSKYTNKETEDDDWQLVERFAELIRGVHPDIVSMENVPELSEHSVFEQFIKMLNEENYHCSWSEIDCVDYGVPQKRIRLVLLASKFGDIELMKRTHTPSKHRTVADVISRLKPIEAGEVSDQDALHRSSQLSELNLRRIMSTPMGGGWKDWPEELRLNCHKKKTGKTYRSIYGRMTWDEPAPTMTTQCNGLGNGRFGHPEQHRAISLREAALFQTFPHKYELIESSARFSIKTIARQIGNAVPVRLGRIIARTIKGHLANYQVFQ